MAQTEVADQLEPLSGVSIYTLRMRLTPDGLPTGLDKGQSGGLDKGQSGGKFKQLDSGRERQELFPQEKVSRTRGRLGRAGRHGGCPLWDGRGAAGWVRSAVGCGDSAGAASLS